MNAACVYNSKHSGRPRPLFLVKIQSSFLDFHFPCLSLWGCVYGSLVKRVSSVEWKMMGQYFVLSCANRGSKSEHVCTFEHLLVLFYTEQVILLQKFAILQQDLIFYEKKILKCMNRRIYIANFAIFKIATFWSYHLHLREKSRSFSFTKLRDFLVGSAHVRSQATVHAFMHAAHAVCMRAEDIDTCFKERA